MFDKVQHDFGTVARGADVVLRLKVTNKYVEDGHALVELEIWAENQRGQASAPNGKAVVILPSRAVSSRISRDGSGIDLGYARYPLRK